jgi:hypothetical protein
MERYRITAQVGEVRQTTFVEAEDADEACQMAGDMYRDEIAEADRAWAAGEEGGLAELAVEQTVWGSESTPSEYLGHVMNHMAEMTPDTETGYPTNEDRVALCDAIEIVRMALVAIEEGI